MPLASDFRDRSTHPVDEFGKGRSGEGAHGDKRSCMGSYQHFCPVRALPVPAARRSSGLADHLTWIPTRSSNSTAPRPENKRPTDSKRRGRKVARCYVARDHLRNSNKHHGGTHTGPSVNRKDVRRMQGVEPPLRSTLTTWARRCPHRYLRATTWEPTPLTLCKANPLASLALSLSFPSNGADPNLRGLCSTMRGLRRGALHGGFSWGGHEQGRRSKLIQATQPS